MWYALTGRGDFESRTLIQLLDDIVDSCVDASEEYPVWPSITEIYFSNDYYEHELEKKQVSFYESLCEQRIESKLKEELEEAAGREDLRREYERSVI